MIDPEMLIGGGMLAFFAGFFILALILGIAIYVYTALALMTIGKKLKHPYPWLAWIPFANIALVLQLGGFHWAWVFLLLIPIAGAVAVGVLGIISVWRILEKRKLPGALSLIWIGTIIPWLGMFFYIAGLVILGVAAWKD